MWSWFFAPIVWFLAGALIGILGIMAQDQLGAPVVAGLLIGLAVLDIAGPDLYRTIRIERRRLKERER